MMPYKLVEENGGYYVVNEQTGKRKNKTPINRERAVKYMRALYAIEGGAEMHKEIHDQVITALKRNMDPNTGGGVDRDKLAASDFIDPERRRFPIVTASDIMDAVHSYGRAKPPIPFEQFKTRLIAIAKRKGFTASLPKDWGVETKEITIPGSCEFKLNIVEKCNDKPFETAIKMEFANDDQRKAVFASMADRNGSSDYPSDKRRMDQYKTLSDKEVDNHFSEWESTALRYIEKANKSKDRTEFNRLRDGFDAVIHERLIPLSWQADKRKLSSVKQMDRIIDELKSQFPIESDMNFSGKELSPSLMVYKDATGQDRWVLFSSNAYQDKDREIVSTAALEADVARADKEGNYGPLRWWHVGKPDPIKQIAGPGVDIGSCDFRAMHGRVLVESGTFNGSKMAQAVKEDAKNLQVSVGFFHPRTEPDSAGVFNNIKIFERSLLPAGRASNPFTAVSVIQKSDGGSEMISEKIKAFAALLKDEELVQSILAQAEAKEKEAQDVKAAFKETQEIPPVAPVVEQPVETVKDEPVEVVADEPEVEEDYQPLIGDMSPDAFAGLLAEAMGKAIEPYANQIKELQTGMKTKDDSEAALRGALELQAQSIQSLKSQLDELTGSQPRAATKSYRDSQSADTVVREDSRVKGQKPTVDPDFIKMFVP